MVQRQRRHPFLSLFDGADPNASTSGRSTSTVPTQALYFLNAPFFHDQARALTQLVLHQKADRLNFIYRRALQRKPTEDESARAKKFLATYPGSLEDKWTAWSRVLLASNEFLFID